MAMNDFSVQIGREKNYLIDLGIEKHIINDAFKNHFLMYQKSASFGNN